MQPPRPSSGSATEPRRENPRRGIGNGLITTPFTKLARVHALSVMGDGAIAVALAGSIFFSIDPSDARWRVALYLILTIAPFAVVTPLLGPAIDRARGGRRGMIFGSLALRALVALFMARHLDSLLLFPEAFAMLVLQKGYGVSKAALVPAFCPHEEELVQANSKLSLIGSISAVFGGGLAAFLLVVFGEVAPTILAAFIFIAATFAATQLPQVQVASEPVDATEKLEVRGANIVLAATAIAVTRGIVGFTTFLLAFHLRAGEDGIDVTEPGSALGASVGLTRGAEVSDIVGTPGPPQWHFAVVGLAAGLGAFLGAKYVPFVRARTTEERIVLGALIATAIAAFLGAWGGGITGTVLLAFGVTISAAMAKLGFDALVQRDAPTANHGRQFARFEGRFQLFWALGAFLAVISRIPIQFGALLVALAAVFAAVSYELGRRTDRVQQSSRVAEAIRSRMPPEAVERLESNKTLRRFKPFVERVVGLPQQAAPPGGLEVATTTASRQVDPHAPTVVQARPDLIASTDAEVQTGRADDIDRSGAVPIDKVDWDANLGPQVSGDGVWVAPVEPPAVPGEDGQYRLWD